MIEKLLPLVRSGDLRGLGEACRQMPEGSLAEEDKNRLTREAALSGHAEVLRYLFENHHLYGVAPDERGRNLLHCAALSGDAETAAFAMDVLGFDPMAGDAAGVTPMDLAAKAGRPAALAFFRQRLGFGPEDCYRNPILRGFHPDPSIVRAGQDYYMINSSFTYFPGLPVSHSRDLIHWRVIGHAAERLEESGLDGLPGGYGYWAPDISCDGERFYAVATLRRNTPPYRLQMFTRAENPSGPWEKPVFLPLDGIDPSLFVDDDGRRYILLNPGAILAEISDRGELKSEPRMILFGAARIKPEGAHLLKKDGWYYLFLAEGGTGSGHMETVSRSRSLWGPYAPCPFNPILGRKDPFCPIGRSGHGKPFSLPDGRWMMVYLCGRASEGRTVTGRETALDPLTWTADGWPMVNGLKGPSCMQVRPLPPADGPQRNTEWISPRGDPAKAAVFLPGEIRMRCGGDPAELAPAGLILRRQTESRFTQECRLDLSEGREGDLAGLAGYYDEKSFFIFGLRKEREGFRLTLTEQLGAERRTRDLGPWSGPRAALRVRGDGLTRTLAAGDRQVLALRTEYLCDEGAFGEKRFTGAALGLAAVGSVSAVFAGCRDRTEEAAGEQGEKEWR